MTEAGLQVEDYVSGRGRRTLLLGWDLAPGAELRLVGAGDVVTTPADRFQVRVRVTRHFVLDAETEPVAQQIRNSLFATPLPALKFLRRLTSSD